MKPRHILLLLIGIALIVGPVLAILAPWENSRFSENEVRAMVQHDLLSTQVLSPPGLTDFDAVYSGDGLWAGTCSGELITQRVTSTWGTSSGLRPSIGSRLTSETEPQLEVFGVTSTKKINVSWRFYEKSQTTEVVELIEQESVASMVVEGSKYLWRMTPECLFSLVPEARDVVEKLTEAVTD